MSELPESDPDLETPVVLPARNTHLTHPYARSRVYDLRNYTEKNFWGPFQDDSSANVDWERVEAALIVITHNLHVYSQHHAHVFAEAAFKRLNASAFSGAGPYSFVSKKRPEGAAEKSELDLLDPYGVGGTYMRAVCFLGILFFSFQMFPSHCGVCSLILRRMVRLHRPPSL